MAECSVLTVDGEPRFAAERFERLNEKLAEFTADEQKRCKVWPDVEVLD